MPCPVSGPTIEHLDPPITRYRNDVPSNTHSTIIGSSSLAPPPLGNVQPWQQTENKAVSPVQRSRILTQPCGQPSSRRNVLQKSPARTRAAAGLRGLWRGHAEQAVCSVANPTNPRRHHARIAGRAADSTSIPRAERFGRSAQAKEASRGYG